MSTLSATGSRIDSGTNASNVTRTGQTASTRKLKRLQSRSEVEALRSKLPPEYRVILDRSFAEMSEITPNLFLTGVFGLSKENFKKNKISYVFNVSFEVPDLELKEVDYERVLVDDDPTEDLTKYFDKVSDTIEKVAKKGGHTVVHCVAGVSRSTAILLSYLIKYKKMTLKDAFKRVIEKRPIIKPNTAFFEQLIKYEKRILGSNSCQMRIIETDGVSVKVPDFWITDYPQLFEFDVNIERQRLAQTVGQQNQNAFPATAAAILASNQKSQSSAQSKGPDTQSSNMSNKKKDN